MHFRCLSGKIATGLIKRLWNLKCDLSTSPKDLNFSATYQPGGATTGACEVIPGALSLSTQAGASKKEPLGPEPANPPGMIWHFLPAGVSCPPTPILQVRAVLWCFDNDIVVTSDRISPLEFGYVPSLHDHCWWLGEFLKCHCEHIYRCYQLEQETFGCRLRRYLSITQKIKRFIVFGVNMTNFSKEFYNQPGDVTIMTRSRKSRVGGGKGTQA